VPPLPPLRLARGACRHAQSPPPCSSHSMQAAPAAAAVPNGCPTNAPVVTESAEQLQQAVERVTTFPTTLDPRIFDNATEVLDGQMHPDVREVSHSQ